MNGRERLNCMFRGEKPDRLPMIEWATWWHLTMNRWHEEGLDPTWDNKTVKTSFGLDYDHQVWFAVPVAPDAPRFKPEGMISNEAEYDQLRPYLYSKQAVYDALPMFDQIQENYEKQGDITWFSLDGFFWYPRKLFGIEDHLYSFYDYPELYHRICQDLTEYNIFVVEQITQHFSPQFMTIAEDMSYNLGPMISRDTFDEFLKPYYQQLIPVIKRKNVKVFTDSDGDITKMIPWLMEAGLEGILPLERQAGVDLNVLTRQYPDFWFVGGYDKMVMKFGEEAMRKEFERILPAMRRGNYIPSVDHQTPPDVSLDNYRIYLRLFREYAEKAVQNG